MAAKFELAKNEHGQYHFHLKVANGQVILSSQKYGTKADAVSGIESVRKNALQDVRFARKMSTANEPYFVLTATNGQIIGTSQMYSSSSAMESGIASVKANSADAGLDDSSS